MHVLLPRGTQLLEALNLGNGHAAVGVSPAVEGSLGDAMFTANGSNGFLTFLSLVEDLDDLLGGILSGLHVVLLLGGSYHFILAS